MQLLQKEPVQIDAMNTAVNALTARLQSLRQKCTQSIDEECEASDVVVERVKHLMVTIVRFSY